jgi:hypothetical protein
MMDLLKLATVCISVAGNWEYSITPTTNEEANPTPNVISDTYNGKSNTAT